MIAHWHWNATRHNSKTTKPKEEMIDWEEYKLDLLINHIQTVQISQRSVIFFELSADLISRPDMIIEFWLNAACSWRFLRSLSINSIIVLLYSIIINSNKCKKHSFSVWLLALDSQGCQVWCRNNDSCCLANLSASTAFTCPWLSLSTVMRTSCDYCTPTVWEIRQIFRLN